MENKTLSRKRQLLYLATIVALILLTFIVLRANKPEELNAKYLWNVFLHMKPGWLVLGIGAMVMMAVIEGQCLAVLAKPLGYRLSFRRATAYAAADLYFSAITPSATGGQPASAYYMIKDGVKASDATAILMLNVLQYTGALVILSILAVFIEGDFFFQSGWVFQCLFILGLILQALLVVLCFICISSKVLVKKLRNLVVLLINKIKLIKRKEARIRRLDQYISKYHLGVEQMKKERGARVVVFVGNFLQRLAFFAIGYCVYRSLGLDAHGFWELVAIQCMLAIVTYSLPIPGGVGLSEGGFLLLFQAVYPAAILTPAMLFTRGINFYLCFIACGIYTMVHHVGMLRRNHGG